MYAIKIKGVVMKEEKILYKLKSIEKTIARILIQNDNNLKEKVDNNSFLTPTQIQIIEYILEHKNKSIYQRDLEKVLNLRRATVSGVLKTMEKNNLIEREKDVVDGRNKRIILNPLKEEIFLKREKELLEIEKIILNGITSDELNNFMLVLDKIKNNLNIKLLEENDNRKGE